MPRPPLPFAPALLVLCPLPAWACPSCPTAVVVRASVFGEDFWVNLTLVSLPALVLASIGTLLYRIGEPRSPGKNGASEGLER